jgi:endonuclease YncB( thermonuclease family)
VRRALCQRSRQSLAELAFGRTATVAVSKIDDYGRAVGTVTVGGVNVEAEQVRRGLAWVYRQRRCPVAGAGSAGESGSARAVGQPESDPAVGLAAWRHSRGGADAAGT